MKLLVSLTLTLSLTASGCRDSDARTVAQSTDTRARTQVPVASAQTQTAAPNDYAARFVSHVDHIQPGGVQVPRGMQLRNPYEGSAAAIANGAKLFVSYNCVDCHGADGSGAMGPSLADGRWHFGGTSPEVFESIYQGRPEGMPAWGSLISADQIWTLVTYVRSLQNGKDVTTENFSGATVERTGH